MTEEQLHVSVKGKRRFKSFEAYPQLTEFITKGSKLTIEDIEKLELIFGERVKKALELVGANRVKKYIFHPSGLVRWVVKSKHNDYILIEHSFCSCKDFLFKAIMKRNIPSCYHLLAREIAERTEKYEIMTKDDDTFSSFIEALL